MAIPSTQRTKSPNRHSSVSARIWSQAGPPQAGSLNNARNPSVTIVQMTIATTMTATPKVRRVPAMDTTVRWQKRPGEARGHATGAA